MLLEMIAVKRRKQQIKLNQKKIQIANETILNTRENV